MSYVLAQFAAELDKGVAVGLTALGPLTNPTLLQGGGGNADSIQGQHRGHCCTHGFCLRAQGPGSPHLLGIFQQVMGQKHQQLLPPHSSLDEAMGLQSPHQD